MKLYIKNMVCNRCVFVVEKQMDNSGHNPVAVELGEIDFGKVELTIYKTIQNYCLVKNVK